MQNDSNKLIDHVKTSIINAENYTSKLIPEILDLDGMSGKKVKHFLNNILYNNANYLEIGVFKGSTLCSALYKNNPKHSISIDNFSEFGNHTEELYLNVNKYSTNLHRHINADCFNINLEEENIKDIDIYFYDGRHYTNDQYLAVKYYINAMSNCFILIVDDWNGIEPWDVKGGTMKAIEELKLKTHLYQSIPDYDILMAARGTSDAEGWWNGLGVFVLEK